MLRSIFEKPIKIRSSQYIGIKIVSWVYLIRFLFENVMNVAKLFASLKAEGFPHKA